MTRTDLSHQQPEPMTYSASAAKAQQPNSAASRSSLNKDFCCWDNIATLTGFPWLAFRRGQIELGVAFHNESPQKSSQSGRRR